MIARAWIAAVLLAFGLSACGGSGSTSSSTSTSTTSTPATTSSPSPRSSAVSSGPVRAMLTGQNHAPKARVPWRYSVRVTDSSGRALSGTVEIEFAFGGQVVGRDTPPVHLIKNGRWADRLTFPSTAVGQPLMFQAVVHTNQGSVTLDWPITARP